METIWIYFKPSLFQHIGTFSSLKGKIQKLTDKDFGKHYNPAAVVATSITEYDGHTLEKAYTGEKFFWGLQAVAGDTLIFKLTPPVKISSIKFQVTFIKKLFFTNEPHQGPFPFIFVLSMLFYLGT